MLFFVALALSVTASTSNEVSKVKVLKSYNKITDSEDLLRLSSNLSNLRQQNVGQNCGATNIFLTEYVSVFPYPISAGHNFYVTQVGSVFQDTFIEENVIGICYNNMIWSYYPLPLNETFSPGARYELNAGLNPLNTPGAYTINMQLVSSGIHISCWEFSFNI